MVHDYYFTYENEQFKYSVELSKRRTISISVLSDGSVIVRAPLRVSEHRIAEVIKDKQEWIVQKKREIIKQDKVREQMDYLSYKDGSNLLYEGKLYPLHINIDKNQKRPVVKFEEDGFHIRICEENSEEIRLLMRSWYREKARLKFTERVEYYNSYLHFTYGTIRIKEQKGCYGSCSVKGNLNFNWKCILAPPEILDYVVVHELCHLKYMNHSRQFWSLVEQILPDYKERNRWLKEKGRILTY